MTKYTATNLSALADFLDRVAEQQASEINYPGLKLAAEFVRRTRIVPEEQLTPLDLQVVSRGRFTVGGFIG